MALVKIYAEPKNHKKLINGLSSAVKLVVAAALNVPKVPTRPSGVETVSCSGVDLVGIDYILEVIAVERPNEQQIANNIIEGLNRIYPELFFSVYFVHILENTMANTPRKTIEDEMITMDEAVERSLR